MDWHDLKLEQSQNISESDDQLRNPSFKPHDESHGIWFLLLCYGIHSNTVYCNSMPVCKVLQRLSFLKVTLLQTHLKWKWKEVEKEGIAPLHFSPLENSQLCLNAYLSSVSESQIVLKVNLLVKSLYFKIK